MGALISRSGKIYLDFRFKGQRCREVTRLPDTPQNRRKCEAVLKRIEAEIVLGTFDYAAYFPDGGRVQQFRDLEKRTVAARSGAPCFQAFAETWFAERRIEWRRSYAETNRLTIDKYLLPRFGGLPVDQIDKGEILAFRSSLSGQPGVSAGTTLSAARINKIMMPLRMILTEAADRFGFATPWRNIKPVRQKRTDVDPFTLEEVTRFLQAVRPDMRNYFTVRFFTGLRTSEVNGLRWHNVDFARCQILIREALVQGHMEPTKTDGSMREVLMNHLVHSALVAQKEATGNLSEHVFCMRSGNPLIVRNVTNRVWYPTLRHLGLRPRRPYQTRHTAATLWLASGENPEWIARQMGHSSTEMLFRVYSRFVPNLTRQDGSAFEQLLRSNFDDDLVSRKDHSHV